MEETKEEHKENLNECVEILERVIILLEDNPDIKDIQDFYKASDLIDDVDWIKSYIKGVLKNE